MKILIVDNHDSFTYNLLRLIESCLEGKGQVEIQASDALDWDRLEAVDKIVLSPGPGIPEEAGQLLDVIARFMDRTPILGVCLGHQAIARACGASLYNLHRVFHGVSSQVFVRPPAPLFGGLGDSFEVGRYHSWAVSRKDLPDALRVTAFDEDGRIMALSHQDCDVHGVQFHPESFLTPAGARIMANFLNGRTR